MLYETISSLEATYRHRGQVLFVKSLLIRWQSLNDIGLYCMSLLIVADTTLCQLLKLYILTRIVLKRITWNMKQGGCLRIHSIATALSGYEIATTYMLCLLTEMNVKFYLKIVMKYSYFQRL